MSTFLVVLFLLLAVILAVRKLWKDFRNGKSCGNCSACPHPCSGQKHTEEFRKISRGELHDDT